MRQFAWLAPLVALALAACGQSQSVDKPMAEVYSTLTSMPAEADAMPLATTFSGTAYYVEPAGDNKVVWHFTRGGGDYGRYVAELAPDGPGKTKVTTHFENGNIDSNLGFLRDIAKLASEASVRAALEGHAVDRSGVQSQISQMIASNPVASQVQVIETVSDRMDQMAPPDPCKYGSPKEQNSYVCQRHGHDINGDTGVITRSDTGQVVNSTDQ